MKITKKAQRAILKDIRKQLVWIEEAIKEGDQYWIDIYANQLAATGGSLHSEAMKDSLGDVIAVVEVSEIPSERVAI
jgi:hypothetical protein